MAGKRLPKDIDLTKKINPADGFFSQSASPEKSDAGPEDEKISALVGSKAVPVNKNTGGRPRKEGLKNEQFTLTMNPELFEKLRIVAKEQTYGNISALIDAAVKTYCRVNDINLAGIQVDPADLEAYRIKQEMKRNKNK